MPVLPHTALHSDVACYALAKCYVYAQMQRSGHFSILFSCGKISKRHVYYRPEPFRVVSDLTCVQAHGQ